MVVDKNCSFFYNLSDNVSLVIRQSCSLNPCGETTLTQHQNSALLLKRGTSSYMMNNLTRCISLAILANRLFHQVCDWLVSCWKASDLSQDCDHRMSPESWGGLPITRSSYSPVCEKRRQSVWYHQSTGKEGWTGLVSICWSMLFFNNGKASRYPDIYVISMLHNDLMFAPYSNFLNIVPCS